MCLHDPVQFKVFDIRHQEDAIVSVCRLCGKVLSIKSAGERPLNKPSELPLAHSHRT